MECGFCCLAGERIILSWLPRHTESRLSTKMRLSYFVWYGCGVACVPLERNKTQNYVFFLLRLGK